MPKESHTIYCIATCLDGKGGRFKIGQKVDCEDKAQAAKLLSSNRFTRDPEVLEALLSKLKAQAKAKKVESDKDDEIASLKKELAGLRGSSK